MSGPTLMRKGMLISDNPEKTKELAKYIPIEYITDWFRSRSQLTGIENRVLILKSETASGKSTLLPPVIYEKLIMYQPPTSPGIICTQPRVLTAITNLRDQILKWYGTDSANTMSKKILTLGKNTGWITGNSKVQPTINASLTSATLDTLTAILRSYTDEEIMKKYRYILLDEVHERSVSLDTTICMLKNLAIRLRYDVNCPFICLMSATFDPSALLKYFSISRETNFIRCLGENSPIMEMWDRQPITCKNYINEAATIVKEICMKDDPDVKKDILCFIPTLPEAEQLKQKLDIVNSELASADKEVFSLIVINRQTVLSENIDFQRLTELLNYTVLIDKRVYQPTRRLIIANSVAETGLTLDDLKHVIDSGYHFGKEYIPTLGVSGLWPSVITKSRWQQRRGRVGRSFPGVYWPLYPKHIWDMFDNLQKPDIQITDVSSIFIYLISEQYRSKQLTGVADPEFLISDIDLIDLPSPDMLLNCMEKFYALGFLSVTAPTWSPNVDEMVADEKPRMGITKLGNLYTKINIESISPECVRMVMASYSWGISTLDMITIASYLCLYDSGVKVQRDTPKPDMGKIYKHGLPGFLLAPDMHLRIKCLLADDFLDGLITFQAMSYIASGDIYDAVGKLKKWCDSVGLIYSKLLEFIAIRDKFIESFISAGFKVFLVGTSILTCKQSEFMDTLCRYKHAIYDGFRCNLLTRIDGQYYTSKMIAVTVPNLFIGLDQIISAAGYTEVLKFEPTYLVHNGMQIKKNAKGIFVVKAPMYSVMDGFVSIDTNFMS